MAIPQDPFMLLSFINMKLRDGDFDSFEELCDSLGTDPSEIKEKLAESGFEYMPEIKQFR